MKAKIFITIKGGNIQSIVSNQEIEVTILDKDFDYSIMTDEDFNDYKKREATVLKYLGD